VELVDRLTMTRPRREDCQCSRRQVMNAKKKLLDTLHEDVAAKEDGGLKRLLGEDESVAKRRSASVLPAWFYRPVCPACHGLTGRVAPGGCKHLWAGPPP
jgi:hypothetical protein